MSEKQISELTLTTDTQYDQSAAHAGGLQSSFNALNKIYADEESKSRYPAQFTERHFTDVSQVRTIKELPDGRRLEQPTPEAISALQEDDPRIEVIHAQEGTSVWQVLAERLDQDFAEQEVVAIRSVEASLDGLVSDGTHDTHDIRDILRVGDIQMRPGVNVAGFWPGQGMDEPFRIHHRVQQYGSQTDFYRDYVVGGDVEGVDRIFPVVLVYDTALLGGPTGGHYGHGLPESEGERSQVIQKAYVLDTVTRA